jgi:hypothetical protein
LHNSNSIYRGIDGYRGGAGDVGSIPTAITTYLPSAEKESVFGNFMDGFADVV